MRKKIIIWVCLYFLSVMAAAAENNFQFGIASIMSPEKNLSFYREFSEYLGRNLDKQIELIFQKNYAAMNKMIEDGAVDFAIVCSGAFQFLPQDRIRILAIPVVRGKLIYNSYIITHKNSGARTFHELKGKIFVFTDPLSNSGHMYPKYLLRQSGYTAENFFSKSYYSYSHDRSVYLVNRGVVDGAAVDSHIYHFMKEEQPETVENTLIIDVSMDFTTPPLVSSPRLNEEEFNRIRRILIQMHENLKGKRILTKMKIDRFDIPLDNAFSNVKKILYEETTVFEDAK